MTETTDHAARRNRYAEAIRETDGWVLDGGQHTLDAVIAVADAEQADLRTANERMRHELDVMYGGAFDSLPVAAATVPASAPTPVSAPAPVSDDLLAAQLAPLEAQARAGREQQRAQHRVEVLREAADRLDTRAASVGDVSDDPAIFVAKARIHDAGVWREAATELRLMAACQECEWGVEHTEHCPYPESHNWGCDCPTDQAPASGPGGVAGETQQPERPRCPHCRMPHDLTPSGALACASIRASIADSQARQPEVHGALLATRCDACRHTLNWHRNDVGCTVVLCVCGRFQEPAAVSQPETEA